MGVRALLATLVVALSAARALRSAAASCDTAQTCGLCISQPDCAWCASREFSEKSGVSRCRSAGNKDVLKRWCDQRYVVNPTSGKTTVVQDEPFKGAADDEMAAPVQIRPQEVKLSLRVGEFSNLTIRYKRARDRPVDMYYLLDVSTSLELVKHSVARLTADMENLTSSLHLGLGSFLDKDVAPFHTSAQQLLARNGKTSHDSHPRIYSYKNHNALSRDTTRVQEALYSLERPAVPACYKCARALLDGVVQSMACKHELKWRQNAHRLIVAHTDNDFHIAGDGKFAGLIEANDGFCHLDDKGEYTHSLLFDYPSISQVKKTSKENNVNVFLVVPEESMELHEVLEELIDEVSVITYSKSQDLVSLITSHFKKMSGTVKLSDNRGDNVDVKYFTKCGNENETESNTCSFGDSDEVIIFTARIKVTGCPRGGGDGWRRLVVRPSGADEVLVVQLDVACDCESCEVDRRVSETNSSTCSSHGDLSCGACFCRDGFIGSRCECAGASTPQEDRPACRGPNGKMCSGFGSCICSTCQCSGRRNPNEKFYGHFCECDNFSCLRHEGRLCAENGDCSCGKCVCRPGWTGEACQCADTMEGCRQPSEAAVCSGRGHCECGQCVCDQTKDGHHYSGQFCEESPTESGLKCKYFQTCAECEVGRNRTSEECLNCSSYNAILLDDIRDDEYDSDLDKICPVTVEENCVFYYRYRFQKKFYRHWVQKEVECSQNILGIIFGVIGFTFLVGLLIILIWKCLTSLHDKREFASFENERAKAKWDQHGNPLFKPSTTTFTNPTFGKE